MRHLVKGRKLKRTSSHKKALMRNMATSLFQHKKIETTEAKAKELRPYAEQLITKAKRALQREKLGLLPAGQTLDIHSRRMVFRYIKSKAVVQELFDTIAPAVEDRPGGYCRIIKTGFRRGDAGKKAIIELVDWAAPQDGAYNLKSRKRRTTKKTTQVQKSTEQQIENSPITETAPKEIIDEVIVKPSTENATQEEVVADNNESHTNEDISSSEAETEVAK